MIARLTPLLVAALALGGCFDLEAAHADCYASGRCKQTDALPPAVVSTIPLNRATDVEPGTQVTITFDKPMQPATVEASLVPHVELVAAEWSLDNTQVKLTPNATLAFATQYTLRLSGTAVDGGKLEASNIASFTVRPAPTGPSLASSVPAHGSNLVALDAGLRLTFDGPVNPASFGASTNPPLLLGAPQWSTDSQTVTFPSAPRYLEATTYVVSFDGQGQNGVALSPPKSVTFETVSDVTPPTVQGVNPANGAVAVSLTTVPTITFSEPMNTAQTLPALSISPADAGCQWTFDTTHKIVSCSHLEPFAPDAGHTVTVAATATDKAGLPLQGPFSFTFQTGPVPDTTAPTLLSTDPQQGDTGVDPSRTIALTFSEPMDRVATESAVTILSPSGTIPAGMSWSQGDTVLTFGLSPYPPLGSSVSYRVETTARDVSQNALAAPVTRALTIKREVVVTLPSVAALDGEVRRYYSSCGVTPTYSSYEGTASTIGFSKTLYPRTLLSFDLTPVLQSRPIQWLDATLSVNEVGYLNDPYGAAKGPAIAENVKYGGTLTGDSTTWHLPARAGCKLPGGCTAGQLTYSESLSNQIIGGAAPMQANVVGWMKDVYGQWDGGANDDRFAQFRIRSSNDGSCNSLTSTDWSNLATADHADPAKRPTLVIRYYGH